MYVYEYVYAYVCVFISLVRWSKHCVPCSLLGHLSCFDSNSGLPNIKPDKINSNGSTLWI